MFKFPHTLESKVVIFVALPASCGNETIQQSLVEDLRDVSADREEEAETKAEFKRRRKEERRFKWRSSGRRYQTKTPQMV